MLNEREITQPLSSPLDGWKRPRKLVEKKGRDERIDRLVAYFEHAIEGSLDGDAKRNRWDCSTLLKRFEKDYPQHDPEKLCEALITAGRQDQFHGPNTRSFSYLVKYAGRIIEARKRKSSSGNTAAKMADLASRFADPPGDGGGQS